MKDIAGKLMKAIRINKGQGLVEYALLVGTITFTVFLALQVLGGKTPNLFSDIVVELTRIAASR